jgi:Spy/CpxP family protein refolding chaperone
MKRTAIALLVLLAAACSSTYDDAPQAPPQRAQRGGMGMRAERAAGALDMLPPDQWWRDPQIAGSVNLTSDQVSQLDNLSKTQGDDAARLERDSMVAVRDLRTTLGTDKPSADEITNSANRIKQLRDALFDRQVQLLAAERTLLSQQQWSALQTALQSEREERMNNRRGGYPGGRGGRGGWGGRGRFPG